MQVNCLVEVGILRSFDIQIADSPQWMARIEESKVVTSIYTNRQQRVAWKCDWQGVTTNTAGNWQAEIRIPFAGLLPMQVPKQGNRWRVTCDVHSESEDGDSPPIAYWGKSDHADIEEGMLIVFGSQ